MSTSSTAAAALEALRSSCTSNSLSLSNISADHSTITLGTQIFPSSTKLSIPKTTDGSESAPTTMLTYSLLSLLLQIYNPNTTLMQYRSNCKTYKVEDAVKFLHKSTVLNYFRGSVKSEDNSAPTASSSTGKEGTTATTTEWDDMDTSSQEKDTSRSRNDKPKRDGGSSSRDNDEKRRHRDRDREKESRDRKGKDGGRDRDRDKDRRIKDKDRSREKARDRDKSREKDRSSKTNKKKREKEKDGRDHTKRKKKKTEDKEEVIKKKEKTPMTQDQLFQNLKTVVVKRSNVKIEDKTDPLTTTDKDKDVSMEPTTNETTTTGSNATSSGGASTTEPNTTTTKTTTSSSRPTTPSLITNPEELAAERAAVTECLSCEGYRAEQISKDDLEKDLIAVSQIMELEIPVGDSSSVLRCGAPSVTIGVSTASATTPKKTNFGAFTTATSAPEETKDFSKVLTLYKEALAEEQRALKEALRGSSSSSRRPGSKPSRPVIDKTPNAVEDTPKGKPVIIVPNAMTSAITLVNAHRFFQDAVFQSREAALKASGGAKRTGTQTVAHTVSSRNGGGTVEYELIDNPATKLKTKEDWDRVVAVVAQGAAWQFKGWRMGAAGGWGKGGGGTGYNPRVAASPVDVFGNAFGFYVGFEGAPLPKDLKGWNVKMGIVSRDKRGFDSVVLANFWNGLEEWMSVHKRAYLPKSRNE